MTIFEILITFALIAGNLSYKINDAGINPEPAKIVPSHLRAIGYTNITAEDVEKFDEEMCTKNGGPHAYDELKRNLTHFHRCIQSAFGGAIYLVIAFSDEFDPGSRIIHRMLCGQVPMVENCFKNLTKTMKTCLKPEKHENVNIIRNTISSLMQFLCENGTGHFQHLIEIMTDSERTCLESNSNAKVKTECLDQTVYSYIRSKFPNGAAVGGLGAIDLLDPDVNKCTVFEKFQNCSIEILNNCTSKAAVLVDSMFNVVKRSTATCLSAP